MTRVKKAVHALKYRRSLLKETKGYRFARSKKERAASEAMVHAGAHAFRDRRDKKNVFRRLWNVRLNAGLREHGTTYSRFIGAMNKKGMKLNRKMLSELAAQRPDTFKRVVEKVTA
ncbi:MAG: large subunit ribosomal protein L20 [Parcubacteria group bacterium Gr01-1014_72]|nr:MAG: large subunit ribosomal protein L20 [Parcubacteria group bacterium Gr01-1014_72]